MMNEILSLVTGSTNVECLVRLDAAKIVHNYKELFDVDVSSYFVGHDYLDLYKCLESGLAFFIPQTVVGDGKFYESIQRFDWYYVDEKWEFSKGLEFINQNDKVLEIGSGRGQYLKLLQSKTAFAEGLELNENGVEKMRANGLKAHLMKIGDFEQQVDKNDLYDVVCSFQVYEHIENIGEVIKSSLNVLKPGGRLIISVPNSNSLYNNYDINPFNMPPHHQGLWYPDVFKKLPEIFKIKLENVYFEPISFVNRFRLAAADTQIKASQGNKKSLQYLRSLGNIFSNSSLRYGRTMLACYEKLA